MIKKTISLLCAVMFAFSCNSNKKEEKTQISLNNSSTKQDSKLTESIKRGKIVYDDFCMACHLPNGEGITGSFPPLAKSDFLSNKREESLKAIKFGMTGEVVVNGETYNSVMTPLGLTDEEVADVMNYISNSWGNKNNTLTTVEEVSKIQQ